jgi:putative transposase
MKKAKFSESQIVNILKEAEAGIALEELVRQHGFCKASFYKWKAKYSGMSASDLKRPKELEKENRRLKQMYANLSLEHAVLKDIIEKKLKPEGQRELAKYAISEHEMSERQAYQVVNLNRGTYRYQASKPDDHEIEQELQQLSESQPHWAAER